MEGQCDGPVYDCLHPQIDTIHCQSCASSSFTFYGPLLASGSSDIFVFLDEEQLWSVLEIREILASHVVCVL